jgi:hypothetical protein
MSFKSHLVKEEIEWVADGKDAGTPILIEVVLIIELQFFFHPSGN